jgi:hypothetical protein
LHCPPKNFVRKETLLTLFEKEFIRKDGSRIPVLVATAVLKATKVVRPVEGMKFTKRAAAAWRARAAARGRAKMLRAMGPSEPLC